jgi:predicted peptidase
MAIPLLLATVALAARPAHPDVVARFQVCQFQATAGTVAFRLHVPRPSSRPLPLVVWLHGHGEAGDNNRDQLAWLELVFRQYGPTEGPPCYILALQRPRESPSWHRWDDGGTDPLGQLDAVCRHVTAHHAVDRQRIYLAGISEGASGCWALLARDPQRFAAVLAMGACELPVPNSCHWGRLPIWAFLSAGDGDGAIAKTGQLIAAALKRGARAALTVVPVQGHNCWTAALRQHAAWEWLLAQRPDAALSYPPGWSPSHVRRMAVAVALSLAGSIWIVRRMRR